MRRSRRTGLVAPQRPIGAAISARALWTPTASRVAALAALLLLLGVYACSDRSQRPATTPPTTSSPTAPAAPPPPEDPSVPEEALERLTLAMCQAYEDWPSQLLADGGASAAAIVAELTPVQRAALQEEPLVARVTAACPQAFEGRSLTAANELPRLQGTLDGLPGLYAAGESPSPDGEQVRYEWTAVGLGCLSLTDGQDADMRVAEQAFLEGMGYSLDSYVEASLSYNDEEMSERIFQAIVACAERSGAAVAE